LRAEIEEMLRKGLDILKKSTTKAYREAIVSN